MWTLLLGPPDVQYPEALSPSQLYLLGTMVLWAYSESFASLGFSHHFCPHFLSPYQMGRSLRAGSMSDSICIFHVKNQFLCWNWFKYLSCFSKGTINRDNQTGKEKFLFVEIFQLIYKEEMIELKYHPFVSPKELIMDWTWLETSQKKRQLYIFLKPLQLLVY